MINSEAFELIEQRKEEGVTAEYLAQRLDLGLQYRKSWREKFCRRAAVDSLQNTYFRLIIYA